MRISYLFLIVATIFFYNGCKKCNISNYNNYIQDEMYDTLIDIDKHEKYIFKISFYYPKYFRKLKNEEMIGSDNDYKWGGDIPYRFEFSEKTFFKHKVNQFYYSDIIDTIIFTIKTNPNHFIYQYDSLYENQNEKRKSYINAINSWYNNPKIIYHNNSVLYKPDKAICYNELIREDEYKKYIISSIVSFIHNSKLVYIYYNVKTDTKEKAFKRIEELNQIIDSFNIEIIKESHTVKMSESYKRSLKDNK